jgi:ABC-type sugar transport system ATPase subunit
MAEISLNAVGKTYPGGIVAVLETTLDFRDGEFIVLVGPSGCGKSTLLRMIAGLESITHGTISIGRTVVNQLPASKRNVAMVFQNYALYPHMTVRNNMAFALERRARHGLLARMLGSAEARAERQEIMRAVEDTARSLGIGELLDRLPRELSGGQRQRVALGRALVRDPKVFLLDEPLSNLDAALRVEMRAELRALHRRTRATMVHVTHDQEEAMTLADRMVVMRKGVVQQFATPTECYANPANRFVAGFVGVPTMNFIEGRVDAGHFVAEGLRMRLPEGRWRQLPTGALVLGVRPDRIAVVQGTRAEGATRAGDATGAVATLPGRIEALEQLGDRCDVVARVAGRRIVARVAPNAALREDSDATFAMDLTQAHLFAPGDDGARLPVG